MNIGDTIEIFKGTYVAAIDKSTREHKLFELWNVKTGERVAFCEPRRDEIKENEDRMKNSS